MAKHKLQVRLELSAKLINTCGINNLLEHPVGKLSRHEMKSFINNGFLTRQVSFDPSDIDEAIEMSWRKVIDMNPSFDRNDPSTWTGEVTDSCRVAAIPKRRGRVKLRECVMKEPLIRKLVHENEEILTVVRALLGPKATPRKTPRGLYPLFPSKTSSHALHGGMDAHPFQVSCIIYLTDVPDEDHGPFNVWAGSHKVMHECFPEGRASWAIDKNKAESLRQSMEATCHRIPITGTRGTVVFWHHRALHTPGTNRSDAVRQVIIGDFHQSDWPDKARAQAPHVDDIWTDWAIGDEDIAPLPRRLLNRLRPAAKVPA